MQPTTEGLVFQKEDYFGGWFRYLFFVTGVGFTYLFITVGATNSNGEPVTGLQWWLTVLLFFPLFWGMAFVPWTHTSKVAVNERGMRAIFTKSKTIFHPKKKHELWIDATDIREVCVEQDQESTNTWWAHIELKKKIQGYERILIPGHMDEHAVISRATLVAEILGCKVVNVSQE